MPSSPRPANAANAHNGNDTTPTNRTAGPIPVIVSMDIRSVSDLDEKNMQYRMQINFRMKWRDTRLAYRNSTGTVFAGTFRSPSVVVRPDAHVFWIPDVIFVNEKESHVHRTIRANSELRASEDGDMAYTARFSLVLFCPMDFSRFPFDEQMCPLRISTFQSKREEVVLRWSSDSAVRVTRPSYVTTQFHVMKVDHGGCNGTSSLQEENQSCLEVVLELARPCNYYLVTVYAPCVLMVSVAWLALWLCDRYLHFALLVVALSSLVTHVAFVNASLPAAPYNRAVDVWTGGCITFVFAALVHFVVLDFSCRCTYRAAKQNQECDAAGPCGASGRPCPHWPCALWVDRAVRIAFPALFVIFTFLYWLAYALV